MTKRQKTRDKLYTAADVIEHVRYLHPDAPEDELDEFHIFGVPQVRISDYPRWRLVRGMPTDKFIPRRHDEDIAADYASMGIEKAPAIIAVPTHGDRRYSILDGAHRHAAAVLAGKGIDAFIPDEVFV